MVPSRSSAQPQDQTAARSVLGAAATLVGSVLALASAAWLIPASIHIVSWGNGAVGRVALFAPAFWLPRLLVASMVLAAAVWWSGDRGPAARARRAWVLTPCLALWAWVVPFLPFAPDRLPLLLVLSGPFRFALALGVAVAVFARALHGRSVGLPSPARFGRRTAFVLALVIYLIAGERSVRLVGLGGDEPHYLVLTQSLLLDHDITIENNHQRGDYRQYFGGQLRPDYLARGVDGEIYSIHAPGLPALVLPAFVAAGAWGAVAMMCLFGALAALAVFDLAELVGGRGAAWCTWASVCFTVPFIPHAWAIFPEMAGAAIVAWALLWVARSDTDPVVAYAWRGVCIGVLPWLHTKFSVCVAVLALALAWRVRRQLARLIAVALPIAVLGAAWVAFFVVIYGTADPQAPYGTYTTQFVRLENLPRSLAGAFFDQKFGLFVYAPIYVIAVWGGWRLLREPRWRSLGIVSLGLAVLYVGSSARLYMWWGGSSAPARFLVPVVPLLAPALALAFSRLRTGLVAAHVWIALAWSLCVSCLSLVQLQPALLFSNPHGVARLAELFRGGSPLPSALPTFTEENWLPPTGRLGLWLVAAGVGVLCARWWWRRMTRARRAAGEGAARVFWPLVIEGAVTLLAASVFVGPYGADARAETVRYGRAGLLMMFDPDARRGLDYRGGRLSKMTPQQWTDAASLTFRLDPAETPDPQGRLTEGLELPPGLYQVSVAFDASSPRQGDVLAALGGGSVLARGLVSTSTVTTLRVPMPIAVPRLWVQLSDPASAGAARRVDIVPQSIVPVGARLSADVRRVESVPGRADAYLAYVNDNAFGEGGVFWTRGTSEASLLVAPAGAAAINLTLHAGPAGSSVRVRVNDTATELTLSANETRSVAVPIPVDQAVVRLSVRSSTAFRPSDVEPTSTDTRLLGCQVRVDVMPTP